MGLDLIGCALWGRGGVCSGPGFEPFRQDRAYFELNFGQFWALLVVPHPDLGPLVGSEGIWTGILALWVLFLGGEVLDPDLGPLGGYFAWGVGSGPIFGSQITSWGWISTLLKAP